MARDIAMSATDRLYATSSVMSLTAIAIAVPSNRALFSVLSISLISEKKQNYKLQHGCKYRLLQLVNHGEQTETPGSKNQSHQNMQAKRGIIVEGIRQNAVRCERK